MKGVSSEWSPSVILILINRLWRIYPHPWNKTNDLFFDYFCIFAARSHVCNLDASSDTQANEVSTLESKA